MGLQNLRIHIRGRRSSREMPYLQGTCREVRKRGRLNIAPANIEISRKSPPAGGFFLSPILRCSKIGDRIYMVFGPVAQLGECTVRIRKVGSSILLGSTSKSLDTFVSGLLFFWGREGRTRESLCDKKSCQWQVFRTERRRCYAPSHKYASGLPPQTVDPPRVHHENTLIVIQ